MIGHSDDGYPAAGTSLKSQTDLGWLQARLELSLTGVGGSPSSQSCAGSKPQPLQAPPREGREVEFSTPSPLSGRLGRRQYPTWHVAGRETLVKSLSNHGFWSPGVQGFNMGMMGLGWLQFCTSTECRMLLCVAGSQHAPVAITQGD